MAVCIVLDLTVAVECSMATLCAGNHHPTAQASSPAGRCWAWYRWSYQAYTMEQPLKWVKEKIYEGVRTSCVENSRKQLKDKVNRWFPYPLLRWCRAASMSHTSDISFLISCLARHSVKWHPQNCFAELTEACVPWVAERLTHTKKLMKKISGWKRLRHPKARFSWRIIHQKTSLGRSIYKKRHAVQQFGP